MGGRSGEHEVSLVSAASVIKALDKNKFEIIPIGISKTGKWIAGPETIKILKQDSANKVLTEKIILPNPAQQALVAINKGQVSFAGRLDVVIPIVHGSYGEDGKLQGLLEMANLPYVGCGVLGSALAMDKIIAKQLFSQLGLANAKFRFFIKKDWLKNKKSIIGDLEKHLKYPMFVKPANLGSSVGLSKVSGRQGLITAINLACRFDRRILVEQAILKAKEIECAVLGNNEPLVSVPGRVIPADEFYSYKDKYIDDKTRFEIPAKLPFRVIKRLQALAVQVFKALDLAGMARVDFLLDDHNQIYLNEVNTIPGFTKISMYPKLWQASGLPYHKLLEKLIALAIARHKEKNGLRTSFGDKSGWYK